jgi:hypothetical protein
MGAEAVPVKSTDVEKGVGRPYRVSKKLQNTILELHPDQGVIFEHYSNSDVNFEQNGAQAEARIFGKGLPLVDR